MGQTRKPNKELRSGGSVNPVSCGTTAVHKEGTLKGFICSPEVQKYE
jgi:hypothetical protein